MIVQLTGKIVEKNLEHIVLDVGGVGYMVYVTPDTLSKTPNPGEQTTLKTHLAVRENAMDLYGFLERNDLELFKMLITISGVGPKSALAILGLADSQTLMQAISENNIDYLTKVSGIGKKSAQKIVLELRDKVGNVAGSDMLQDDADVLEALVSMGYSAQEARNTIKHIDKNITNAQDRIKAALKAIN